MGQIGPGTVIVSDINTPLSSIDRSTIQKEQRNFRIKLYHRANRINRHL
jgi:hypothetical protein